MTDRAAAERLAARLPPLLIEARRLAATVAPGVHGVRRPGAGEEFLSFRPYRPGDDPRRIDWKRSDVRDGPPLVREHEQARAATVLVWPDRRASMRWRSAPALPEKADAALLLALATASLLSRGHERAGLFGGPRPVVGPTLTDRLLEALTVADPDAEPPAAAPSDARLLVLTDALEPPELWRERLRRWGATGASGALVRVADPAEASFAFEGRMTFTAPSGRAEKLVGRAQSLADDYRAAWDAQRAAVEAVAAEAGWRLVDHRTDRPATETLRSLWQALGQAPAQASGRGPGATEG